MAITPAITASFKLELLQAIHNLSSDVIKIALYSSSATLDVDTTVYSATNEITGTGYVAGGKILTVSATYPKIDSGTKQAWVRFDPLTWTGATFTTRGGLIYNSSKANRAIAVVSFGVDASPVSGAFNIEFTLTSAPLIVIN